MLGWIPNRAFAVGDKVVYADDIMHGHIITDEDKGIVTALDGNKVKVDWNNGDADFYSYPQLCLDLSEGKL